MILLDRAHAVLYGHFVNAAYSMYDADHGNLTPPPKDIPSGFRMLAWIQMSDFAFGSKEKKFYGFVAQSILNPATHIIAIRGTEGIIEWYDDAMVGKTPFKQVPKSGLVESGFDNIYSTLKVVPYTPPVAHAAVPAAPDAAAAPVPEAPLAPPPPPAAPLQGSFADQIAQLVESTQPSRDLHADMMNLPEPAPPSVAITGHSLGAALCTLYVMDNASNHKVHNPVICTFASPRVGDAVFVTAFNALAGVTSWHIINTMDIVPKLPPAILGYGDVDQIYKFSSWGMVKFWPSCWHSMLTYMHWLDPTVPLDPNCRP